MCIANLRLSPLPIKIPLCTISENKKSLNLYKSVFRGDSLFLKKKFMKTTKGVLYLIFPFFIVSCLENKQAENDVAFIDVTKTYSEKEIFLTDIASVDYLYLNSDDDDYLYSGTISYLTKNTVVVYSHISGDILFFTREGNPKSCFNHKGQGPGEYINAHRVFYDEETDDVFITDFMKTNILVYSSSGDFKRNILLPQETRTGNDVVSYDDFSFFFYDVNSERKRLVSAQNGLSSDELVAPFFLISKIDGEVLDYLELPLTPVYLGINWNGTRLPAMFKTRLLKSKEGVMLCNPESDTVFLYKKNESLRHVIHKTPLVSSTNPMTYLNNCVDMGRYQFMEVFTLRQGDEYPGEFPVNYYMRDKETGEVIRPKILLPDYKGKEFPISPSSMSFFENELYFELDLIEIKQAYYENKLSGKLKELVATLNEDEDNNVFIMVDFK